MADNESTSVTKDLGIVSAYGYAKAAGYTGTEEEFEQIFLEFTEDAPGLLDRLDEAVSDCEDAASDAADAKTAAENAQTAAEAAAATFETDTTLAVSGKAADAKVTGDEITGLKTAITEQSEAIDEYSPEWKNLYNPNDPDVVTGAYVNTDNGNLIQASSCMTTGFVPITPNKYYSTKVLASYMGANNAKYIIFYDANKTRLGQKAGTYLEDSGSWRALKFIITNENAKYIRVSFSVDNTTFMIVEGETYPTEYSEYGKAFKDIIQLNDTEIAQVERIVSAQPSSNILYGKKAAFTGDSICEGAGYSGGYPKIIGDANEMTISNTGRSGATLASGTTASGVNRTWICNIIANMPADYDYYIVEGGVNDAASDNNVQVGELSSGYTATLDTTTLCGAMESICKTLQTTFLGKKYGFIIPHNVYPETHQWNTTFRPAMKRCLEKWGIPYLDLSEKTAELYNVSALRVYTLNEDGWHPTEDGYKLYYVDKIVAWMKTL